MKTGDLTERTLECIDWVQHCTVELIEDILYDDNEHDRHCLHQDDVGDLHCATNILTNCVSLRSALTV